MSLNDEQRAHMAALAASPELVCACGWHWTSDCRLGCHNDNQRPEDKAHMEGYRLGKQVEYDRIKRLVERLSKEFGSALPPTPENNARKEAVRYALYLLTVDMIEGRPNR